ncbi:MAG: FeoB-associated Cys-rich membrane protein [Lachnospiraceae bacterium]|jgi:hypothetical protein|nr:FeoB-associated Cys-rich membrane protein [Lachnospiraceae bacterium]
MFTWIAANAGTIVISLVLLTVVTLIVRKMLRDRRAGRHSCGCGCEHCAMSGRCHRG